jgi:lysine 2,3-aminomutase
MRHRVTTLAELETLLDLSPEERTGIARAAPVFPFAITPYYLSLAQGPDCPVRRQAVPHADELITTPWDMVDPLAEEEHSPVPASRTATPTARCSTSPTTARCTAATARASARSVTRPLLPDRSAIAAALDYLRRTSGDQGRADLGRRSAEPQRRRLVEIVGRAAHASPASRSSGCARATR